MSQAAKGVLTSVLAAVIAFVAGTGCGFYFYPKLFSVAAEVEHDEHDHEAESHGDHLELSQQARANLGLKMGTPTIGDHWLSRTVPGEVVEVPGRSDLSVPTPVAGVIEQVFIREGQSIGPAAKLFTLRIKDAELTASQSQLLATLARQEIVRAEIARLKPLTDSGTVSGRTMRDYEYELKQLVADQNTRTQEILARGLPDSVLQGIVRNRRLADTLVIAVPEFTVSKTIDPDATKRDSKIRPVAYSMDAIENFSIENIKVHPGKSVKPGEALCSLAFHARLYIEGTAFEADLPSLKQLTANDWSITAEFGHAQADGHGHATRRDGLKLLHVDNHVDRVSQTFKFYIPIENQVEQSIVDQQGRNFLQWQFKPGQRVHLKVPTEQWVKQLLVPADAVVVDGPNAFVFTEHEHLHFELGKPREEKFALAPVPVHVLHRDSEVAVLAGGGQLKSADRIALNQAFKLHLAMKMQAGGAGGHGHDH